MDDNKLIFKTAVNGDDFAVIQHLAYIIWPLTYADLITPEQMDYMLHMMYDTPVLQKEIDNGITYEIIYDTARPIGFLSYGPYPDMADTVKLHKLYLLPDYHGRGIGSVMLRRADEQVRRMGYGRIILNVNKGNLPALKSYKKNGYTEYKKVKVDIGDGFYMDDFIMSKILEK